MLIAMSPIVELRGAIPIAIEVYGLSVWSAYFFSVLGNLVPLVAIIALADPVSRFLSSKLYFFNRFFAWLFEHTRKAHQFKFENWGKGLAVVVLTATPIPFIGGWSGAIAAFVFGVPFWRALPLVTVGALLGGAIVTAITLLLEVQL